MAKTYNSIPTVSTGDVYTATAHNNIVTNVNNYRVPPMASLRLSSSVAVATANHTSFAGFTNTNGAEVIDTDDMVTLSATASAITVQTAGVYSVSATTTWAANATGIRYSRIVRSRGGTLLAFAISSLPNIGAGIEQQASLSGLIPCDAGDLIRLMVYQDSGGNLNLLAGAPSDDFGGTRLSATWLGQVS
jgi:hypothetical protein